MTPYFLGIDWGGTRIKLGAVSADGTLLAHDMLSPAKNDSAEDLYAAIVQQLRQMADQLGKPQGIGLALTGPTNPDVGVVLLPGKIKGMEGFPIVPKLRREFGISVWADNDGRAAMFAEKHAGHARNRRWAVTLTIGTGIGSGVMLDRAILRDSYYQFGTQAGHLVMDIGHDQLCLTGARGTGEMLCSATALVLAVRSGLQRGIPSNLTERYWQDPHSIDFRAIIEVGVAQNDRLCMDEMRRWTRSLGWLVVNTIHAYAPEIVILAGGATAASAYYLGDLSSHVAQHTFRYPPERIVPIVCSELGDHIGVIGAAFMVKDRLYEQLPGVQ